jgi:hypothetical protein
LTPDIRTQEICVCARALDRRWSSERKVVAVAFVVRVANLTAGKAEATERETVSAVRAAARELMATSSPVAALSDQNWEATSHRAADWLTLAILGGPSARRPLQRPLAKWQVRETERAKEYAKQSRAYEEKTVKVRTDIAPLYRAWTKTLRGIAKREPRTLDEWVAAGAALLSEPTASYRLETTRKTFRERSGLCAAVRCREFFFLPLAKDGVSPPTGPPPRTCSSLCRDRAADQLKYRKRKSRPPPLA